MTEEGPGTVWRNSSFLRLYVAHAASLVGSGIGTAAIALLADGLRPGAGPQVLGIVLTIRILIVVFLSPFAGQLAERIGRRMQMVLADFLRMCVMVGMFFVSAEWHLYVLAFLLHLGSAFFTPIYKSVIPGVVGKELYPRAVAYGTLAYNLSDILGMTAGAALIWMTGFKWCFTIDAATFLFSALLITGVRLPGLRAESRKGSRLLFGIGRMLGGIGLRRSLMLSLQVSIVGGLAIVATHGYVKNELGRPEYFYPLAMAAMGIGSMFAALQFSYCGKTGRRNWGRITLPLFFTALISVALLPSYPVLVIAWIISGAGQGVFNVISNTLLAENSEESERSHIYAAQFALSHAGWGISYPLCGFLAGQLGFAAASWTCVGLLLLTLVPMLKRST
ncbi:MAG: MFS transporter [Verrucomicrobiaceae bacterium]|nr:MFS transporter [Verrucomicrobiaceae bacterium]